MSNKWTRVVTTSKKLPQASLKSSYQQPVQLILVAIQVPTVCADVSALFLSSAVHTSLSLYAATYEQAPVTHNTLII